MDVIMSFGLQFNVQNIYWELSATVLAALMSGYNQIRNCVIVDAIQNMANHFADSF